MDAVTAELPLAPTEIASKCEHCGNPFEPRKGSGGKPQRFCSSDCRQAFHANAREGQRSPTCDPATGLTAPQEAIVQRLMGEARKGREADFWHPLEGDCKECTAVPSQPAIAVYWNHRDQVVIRQERSDGDDDDVVLVDPKNLRLLIAALEREANSYE